LKEAGFITSNAKQINTACHISKAEEENMYTSRFSAQRGTINAAYYVQTLDRL
jgi:hypothetical protein